MARAAIMTIVSMNLGNRLQNYALQTVLGRYFDRVETFPRESEPSVSRKAARLVRPLLKHDKVNRYRRFDKERIIFSKYRLVLGQIPDFSVAEEYDKFVIGSDQVWNPDFAFNSELEYLPFVPEGKKVAYAASFGVSEIVEGKQRTAELLESIRSISVREDAGAQIVKELTGLDVPVVLDPTMLLTDEEWGSVESRPAMKGLVNPFCLKYVLGDDVNDARIDSYAKEYGMAVVDLSDPGIPVGPAEFVWLVRNAGLVCTDSFHASAFSILFHRPFIVFERSSADKDMSSRLDTLVRAFGLEHHRFASGGFNVEEVFDADWVKADSVLEDARAESLGFLESALRA